MECYENKNAFEDFFIKVCKGLADYIRNKTRSGTKFSAKDVDEIRANTKSCTVYRRNNGGWRNLCFAMSHNTSK